MAEVQLNRSALALKAAVEKWQGDPKRWCKGHLAEDGRGWPVLPGSKDAASWCFLGAVSIHNHNDKDAAAFAKSLGLRGGVCEWNDKLGRTFDQVESRVLAYLGLCACEGG